MTAIRHTVTLLVCAGFSLIVGCASSIDTMDNEALLPEIDIVQLKENSDEALKTAQEIKLQFQVINSRLTEIDNRLVVLSEEVASVSLAKIEDLENRLSLLIEAYKDLKEEVAALEVLPNVRKKKVKTVTPTFSPSSAAAMLSSSEYDQYRHALRVFDKRDYEQARNLFAEQLKKFPKGEYASNAQYWIGECEYALGNHAKAVVAFTKTLEYDKTPKADDAQLKIGLSYLRMGKTSQAREELTRLINRYPNSEYAPRAQKYLANIK